MNSYKYDSGAPRFEIPVEELDLAAASDKIQIKLEQAFRNATFRVGVVRTMQRNGGWKNKIAVAYYGPYAKESVLHVARSFGFTQAGLWSDTDNHFDGMMAIGGIPTYTRVKAEITVEALWGAR